MEWDGKASAQEEGIDFCVLNSRVKPVTLNECLFYQKKAIAEGQA